MNDLTTTQSSTPARPTSPVLSPELTALLDNAGSPEAAQREIAACPALLAETKAALPALKAVAEAKAGEHGVKAVVGRRLSLYPQPARSEGEWDAWWADYFDVLADVPLASLEAGMRAHVASPESEFMPKPGRLRELAFTAPSRSLGRYYRAKMAVQLAEEPPAPALAGPPVDPAAVRQMLADFTAARSVTEAAKPKLPSISGKPDEGGITPEMRALLARRAEERK
jgi:hypothetical protein